MFGKPLQPKNKYSSPRDYIGVSDLASFILSPASSKSPNSAKSAISPKKSSVGVEELISVNTASNTTSETESPSRSRTIQNPLKKTGDSNSFWLSANDNVYIDRAAAMKCYRVVSYRKLKKTGKRVVFDILDGKPMYCGVGVQRKITDNAVVFTSKQDALSERFPSNQVCTVLYYSTLYCTVLQGCHTKYILMHLIVYATVFCLCACYSNSTTVTPLQYSIYQYISHTLHWFTNYKL